MRIAKVAAVVFFLLVLLSLVFVFGFDEGYKQALEDIRDVLRAQPSSTSHSI